MRRRRTLTYWIPEALAVAFFAMILAGLAFLLGIA
jgi:hypothetical protein